MEPQSPQTELADKNGKGISPLRKLNYWVSLLRGLSSDVDEQ